MYNKINKYLILIINILYSGSININMFLLIRVLSFPDLFELLFSSLLNSNHDIEESGNICVNTTM